MTPRNLILIILLLTFLLWYVGDWAYKELYRDPRNEHTTTITELRRQIEVEENNLATMTHFHEQNQWLYYRSLPPAPNDARQYSSWLLELLLLSGFENSSAQEIAITPAPFGADYGFQVHCTGTFEQLIYFLAEFYTAPFLHRITSMTLTPTEDNEDKKDFSMTINALAMNANFNPFRDENQQVTNQLSILWAMGWHFPRLPTNDLTVYRVIADRNLLRSARGGIDDADFTYLTGLPQIAGQKEAWFTVRTTDALIKARLKDTIRSGSFEGRIVEIHDQDIVLDRGGSRWLLTTGESISEAFALPPETAERIE